MGLEKAFPDMQFPHVFIHFLIQYMWFPHGNIAFSLFICWGVPKCAPRWPDMQLPHVFIAFFICDEAFPHVFIAFWHPQASFWEPIGLSWGFLFGMLEGLWSFLGILWFQNGARNIKIRVSKAISAQVEVARGSQTLSMGRFGEDFHHLLYAIRYFGTFSCKKVYSLKSRV